MNEAILVTAGLVFARMGGLLLGLPIFSAAGTPKLAVVFGALGLTWVIAPTLPIVAVPDDPGPLVLAVISELSLGLMLSLSVMAVFAAMAFASELMSMQMGLVMASLFNPLQKQTSGPVGTLATWVSGMLFLGAGLHLRCVEAVGASFAWVPPGELSLPTAGVATVIGAVGSMFSLGLQLAAPLLAMVFMINVLVAVLARLAPRMNVFFSLGMTLTSGVGLLMLAVALPWLLMAHRAALEDAVRGVAQIFSGM